MDYSQEIEQFKKFMKELRNSGYNLGLEPHFSVIESFVLKEGNEKAIYLRENLDRFWEKGRGIKVLEKLRDKAAEQGFQLVSRGLEQFRIEIDELFKGQFLYYPPERFTVLPHSAMLQTIGQMANENNVDKIIQYINEHLEDFDGHFFVILGGTMRNAQSMGSDYTVEFFTMLGRLVAQKRLKAGLPCSFASLYGT